MDGRESPCTVAVLAWPCPDGPLACADQLTPSPTQGRWVSDSRAVQGTSLGEELRGAGLEDQQGRHVSSKAPECGKMASNFQPSSIDGVFPLPPLPPLPPGQRILFLGHSSWLPPKLKSFLKPAFPGPESGSDFLPLGQLQEEEETGAQLCLGQKGLWLGGLWSSWYLIPMQWQQCAGRLPANQCPGMLPPA